VDEDVKAGMMLNSGCILLARQGVLTKSIHHGSTWAWMSFTDSIAQMETDGYADCAVVEVEATGADWKCV